MFEDWTKRIKVTMQNYPRELFGEEVDKTPDKIRNDTPRNPIKIGNNWYHEIGQTRVMATDEEALLYEFLAQQKGF